MSPDPTEHNALARQLRAGDRILVEPVEADDFEATVEFCRGWGLVHGVMDWQMRRDDGAGFVYGLRLDAPVKVVTPRGL